LLGFIDHILVELDTDTYSLGLLAKGDQLTTEAATYTTRNKHEVVYR